LGCRCFCLFENRPCNSVQQHRRQFRADGCPTRELEGSRLGIATAEMNRIDFDTVQSIGLELPGVEEFRSRGSRALKVRGNLLACVTIHGSAEPGTLMVRMDVHDCEQLLAEAPDVYYVTNHYVGYPTVLVRLSRVTPDVLRDLLRMAHKYVSAKSDSPSRT